MWEMIDKMCVLLNLNEDFKAYKFSRKGKKLLIDYKGKRYLVFAEDFDGDVNEDVFQAMERYN